MSRSVKRAALLSSYPKPALARPRAMSFWVTPYGHSRTYFHRPRMPLKSLGSTRLLTPPQKEVAAMANKNLTGVPGELSKQDGVALAVELLRLLDKTEAP